MEIYIYCVTIAFQLAGALVLIIEWFSNSKNLIVREFYNVSGVYGEDGVAEPYYDKARIFDALYKLYTNRIAFIYIAIGYLFNTLGSSGEDRLMSLLLITAISTVITILTILSIKLLSNWKFRKYEILIKEAFLPDGATYLVYEKDSATSNK